MRLVIITLEYGLLVPIILFLGYQILLSLSALTLPDNHTLKISRKRKFALLMLVRRNEVVNARTLYSLFSVLYPKSLYDLYLVFEEASHVQNRLAKSLGAIAIEMDRNPDKSGDDMMLWSSKFIDSLGLDYEAVVIINSDCLISGNFLEVMNYYLEQDCHIIQSSSLLLRHSNGWRSEASRFQYFFNNYIKPKGRKALGLGAKPQGNGICFSTEILKRYRWDKWSVSNDMEYIMMLQLENIKVDFAPEAYTWSQAPENFEERLGEIRLGMNYMQVKCEFVYRYFLHVIKERSLRQ